MLSSVFDDIRGAFEGITTTTGLLRGIAGEEKELLLERCKVGIADFEDFLVLVNAMDIQQAAAIEAIQGRAEPPSGLFMEEYKSWQSEKFSRYNKIIGALTPEQQSDPKRLLVASPGERQKVAKRTRQTLVEIDAFLQDFRTTMAMFSKLASGISFMDAREQLIQEENMLDSSRAPSSRGASRKMRKGGKGTGDGSQPEWMKL